MANFIVQSELRKSGTSRNIDAGISSIFGSIFQKKYFPQSDSFFFRGHRLNKMLVYFFCGPCLLVRRWMGPARVPHRLDRRGGPQAPPSRKGRGGIALLGGVRRWEHAGNTICVGFKKTLTNLSFIRFVSGKKFSYWDIIPVSGAVEWILIM